MYFMIRYSRSLEEGSFRNQPADYLFCLLIGMALILVRGRGSLIVPALSLLSSGGVCCCKGLPQVRDSCTVYTYI